MGDRLDEEPSAGTTDPVRTRPAHAADLLALGRATLDAVSRLLRNAPEVRAHRVFARWPLEPEDVLVELEPTTAQTSIAALAGRLEVGPGHVRTTSLRLQRMGMVRVAGDAVILTSQGRQKLAQLDQARAAALRRIADGVRLPLTEAEAQLLIRVLHAVLEQVEAGSASSGAPGSRAP